MFTVDSALQQTCAELREQAILGRITDSERDLLIDGAVLLAVHLGALIQDARASSSGDPAGLTALPNDATRADALAFA